MSITQSGTAYFDSMLEDISLDQSYAGHSIPYRVGCVKMRAPRDSFFEFMIDMGRINIEDMFQTKPFRPGSLSFVFPERWCSVYEQQRFVSVIEENPTVHNLTSVDIITSSPLLISSFHREQIRILTWDNDDNYNGITKVKILREKI